MRLITNLPIAFLTVILTLPVYGQNHSEQSGDVIWSLGPEDPRVDIRFGTKGINIGGNEMTACIIKNNFQAELLIKVRFTLTDFCGVNETYSTPEVRLASHATYSPNPFYEGFTYGTECKQTAEYGRSKKTRTRIQRITFETLFIRDLTAEKKKAEAEKLRIEAEAEKERQDAEAEKAKAAEAEKARKAKAQAEKDRKVREANATEAAQQKRQTAEPGTDEARASSASVPGNSSRTTATTNNSTTITKDNVADYIYAQQQAKLDAEEAEKAKKQESYEAQMAEFKRIEEAQAAEAQRIDNLVQRHIQHATDADNVREKAAQVEQAQRLENNHNDIARMEREYAQKLADLDAAMSQLEAARRQEWSSRVQTADWKGADGKPDPAVGQLLEATGAFVNLLGEESRKREAKAELDRERANFLARVEAEKAKMRFDLRRNMMYSEFPASRMPTGKEDAPKSLYGFYILFNNSDLGAPKSKVTVSNVIEIGTYADGTWPSPLFFTVSDRETKAKYNECYFHTKMYASSAEAAQIRKAFKDFFSRDGVVTEIYFSTHLNPAVARMDFWETRTQELK